MTISSNSSVAVGPNLRIPKSSMMSSGTVDSSSMLLFAFSVQGRFGDFPEQDVRLPVDHPIALADDRLLDGLGEMTFPGAGRTQKKCIFAASDELGRRQIEDQAPI